MILDKQAIKYRSLDEWFNTFQGARVALAFASELVDVCEQITGETCLQLGSCGDNPWLSAFHFRHKWLATPYVEIQKITLIVSLNALPMDRDSVDCVIAPLTMEAFPRHKNPIDEIDRILKPMGYVIFLGINPCSFWGYALKWGHLGCFGKESATLTSSFSIKRALLNRGYRQCVHTSFYYIPPISREGLIRTLSFLNEMGKMVWPFPAGFYCLIMQKYQPCSPDLLINTLNQEELLLKKKSSLAPTLQNRNDSPHKLKSWGNEIINL